MADMLNIDGREVDLDEYLGISEAEKTEPEVKEEPVSLSSEEISRLKQLITEKEIDSVDEQPDKKQFQDLNKKIESTHQQLFAMQQRFENAKFQLENQDKYPGFSVDENRVLNDVMINGINADLSRKNQLKEHLKTVASIAQLIRDGKYNVDIIEPINPKKALPESLQDFDPNLSQDEFYRMMANDPKGAEAYIKKAEEYERFIKK